MVENRAIENILISVSKTHSFDKESLVFLNTSDVFNGDVLVDTYMSVSEMKGQAKKTIENGDILYSEIRPKNRRFAYVKVDKPQDFVVSTKLMVLRNISNDVLTDYIYYFITYQGFIDYLQMRAENRIGSFPQITFDVLKPIKVPVPSMKVQQDIVDTIKSIDQKIEFNNQINAELEAMAKLVYDYWFVQFDFPISASYAKAMGKPELEGKPYKASGGKMVYNEALKREIPEGWGDGVFGDVAQVIGGSTPSKTDSANFTNGNGTPWITPKDLSNNKGKLYITRGEYDVTERGIKKASLKLMPAGTVLLSSRAPIGYLAIARETVTTNQGFKSFVPKDYFTSEFLFYQIKNKIPLIEARSSGSTFKEVSASTLKMIKIIVPPMEIIKEYQKIAKPMFEKQNILEQENQELASLRDWLLPMLMNGQVTVGEAEEKLNLKKEVAGYGEVMSGGGYRAVAEEDEEYKTSEK